MRRNSNLRVPLGQLSLYCKPSAERQAAVPDDRGRWATPSVARHPLPASRHPWMGSGEGYLSSTRCCPYTYAMAPAPSVQTLLLRPLDRFFHDGLRLRTGRVRSALNQLIALRQCYMIGSPREGYTCSGCHPASLVMAYDAEEALIGRGADPGACATESHHDAVAQETIHVRVVGLRACALYAEGRGTHPGGNAASLARPGAPERCGNGILVVHGIGKVRPRRRDETGRCSRFVTNSKWVRMTSLPGL